MVPTYTVHTLRLGTIRADKSTAVYGFPPGTVLDVPIWAAAVEGNGHRLLVDTGLKDAQKWSRYNPHSIAPDQTIDAALSGLGWQRRDVDLVINSHLHYDHAENNLAFPHAQLFVSRAEWEFAADPGSAQAGLYDLEWTGPDLTYLNYTIVHADHYDVLPGVRIIRTPGHTPGHQSLVVDGTYVLVGDACYCRLALDSDTLPPNAFDHARQREGFAWLRHQEAMGRTLVFSHDLAQWESLPPVLTRTRPGGA